MLYRGNRIILDFKQVVGAQMLEVSMNIIAEWLNDSRDRFHNHVGISKRW